MARKMSSAERRELRIELLRARAAIERQNLRKHACQVADDLAPGALVKALLPVRSGYGGAFDMLSQGAGMLARYPFLFSVLTRMVSGGAKGRTGLRWLRVAVAAVLGWQAVRVVRQKSPGGSGATTDDTA